MVAKEKEKKRSARKDRAEKRRSRKARKSEEPLPEEDSEGQVPCEAGIPPVAIVSPDISSTPGPDEEPAAVEAEVSSEDEALPETEVGEGEKPGWTSRLRRGLSKSRSDLDAPFERAKEERRIGPEFWEELEEALIGADVGVECTASLIEGLKRRVKKERARTISAVTEAFRKEIVDIILSFGPVPEPSDSSPRVLFVVGVNGVGKTTTAAKIGNLFKGRGVNVSFAAADTFRAAGIEQMELWAERVNLPVIRHQPGSDPAAVVFDAIASAKARGVDAIIVDTAGRLHTKVNLMAELNKMWRVADREIAGDPEAILVIDATTGQNGISQAALFSEALPVGSIALTKLDGTAKGGIVLAIGQQMGIPVAYVGVGETLQDLHEFDPEEYARALV